MKTIAILNLKGGTAKTVTAATMAWCLASERAFDTLAIDMDCQGNLSQYFGLDVSEASGTTYQLLTGGAGYWPDFVTALGPHLTVIPSDMELAYVDLPDARANLRAVEQLREVLEEDEAFSYCVIDLPPSLGVAARAALLAADEVIIPIRLDAFSTAGMAELVRQVEQMRRVNPRLRVAGILATQYQRTEAEREVYRFLSERSGLPVFETMIRMSAPVPRSILHRRSVLEESPYCGAAKDYRAFVAEYLKKEGTENG